MDVYRIDLGNHSYRHVKRINVHGEARSNVLEDEIAGCVMASWWTSMKLYMVNWKTGKSAIIDTKLSVSGSSVFMPSSTHSRPM
jgi:hypothetical protein